MCIVPQGHPFISHLLFLASSVLALEKTISRTPCLADLNLWTMFLKQWNGLNFFYDDIQSHPSDLPLFTDAAPSALFELYPIVIAAFLWGHKWSSKNIEFHCDNLVTVLCINKGRSNSPEIMPLLRHLTWLSTCKQFIFKAVHIPGHHALNTLFQLVQCKVYSTITRNYYK